MGGNEDHFMIPKASATRVKHQLLLNYQKVWMGIWLNKLRDQPGSLVYLDTCAGAGVFPGEDGNLLSTAGSPIIAYDNFTKAMSDQRFVTDNKVIKMILFESNEKYAEKLKKILDENNVPKEMYVLKADDYREHIDFIVESVNNNSTLAFIDPFNIDPVPFKVVKRIIEINGLDSIVFFPSMQIQRYQGFIKGAEFPGRDAMLLKMDEYFGSEEWRQIAIDSPNGNDALNNLLQFYMSNIAKLRKHSFSMDFLYEKQEKTLYTIIVITKSSEAGIQIKEMLSYLEEYQQELRNGNKEQGLLFDDEKQVYIEDKEVLAERVFDHFQGKQVVGDDLYAWATFEAGPGVFRSNLKKAVNLLTKDGRLYNPAKSKWNSWSKLKFCVKE